MTHPHVPRVAVIGAGPAGLMAADILSAAGLRVDLIEAMPSPARKLLRAGVGGLNLTHSENADAFLARYGSAAPRIAPWLAAFGPAAVRAFAHGLGVDTFVGSSGRVFPRAMKASPLLRAWLARLQAQGVQLHTRCRWLGWTSDGALHLCNTAPGKVSFGGTAPPAQIPLRDAATAPTGTDGAAAPTRHPAATILALGGGSWPRLGANGHWCNLLQQRGIRCAPLRPANCGFDLDWSAHLVTQFAGAPLKGICISHRAPDGTQHSRQGECLITRFGLEGGVIYALAAPLRDHIAAHGSAPITIDLCPQRDAAQLTEALRRPRGRDSLANHLRRQIGLVGAKAALLREVASAPQLADMDALAALIKAVPLRLLAARPLAEAISSAGGVCLDQLNETLMLNALPGVFCAGEMLDWEAPTGGYLLTACLASGAVAARGVLDWLATGRPTRSDPALPGS